MRQGEISVEELGTVRVLNVRFILDEGEHPELPVWWMQTAAEDLEQAAPKIVEYGGGQQGSADLEVMGDAIAVLTGSVAAFEVRMGGGRATHQEMACWFYLLGKVARLISDYKAGLPGKADTWHDATVYSMMARRIQEVGRWP